MRIVFWLFPLYRLLCSCCLGRRDALPLIRRGLEHQHKKYSITIRKKMAHNLPTDEKIKKIKNYIILN